MDTIRIQHGGTKMVAHRGLSGIEPENSLVAFVAAGNRSYYGIETDVHVTADGQYILTHDSNMRRMTGTDAVAEQTDFATLRALRLLDKDGTVRDDLMPPTLREYIRVCARYGKTPVLELKEAMPPEHIAGILRVLEEERYAAQTVVISFCWDNLAHVRALSPTQRVQFLTGECDAALIERLKQYRFGLDIAQAAVTRELVETLHANGVEINCWMVDNPDRAAELVGFGVDYITSNILE